MKSSSWNVARKRSAALLVASLLASGGLFALEPPTPQQLAQYRLDGTLARRIAFAKALGNDKADPGLVRDFAVRLERLRLKALGRLEAEVVEAAPAPPSGIRQGLRNKGTNKIFALLIEFSDNLSSTSSSTINSKLFGDGDTGYPYESLRNYYRRSSYNLLEIQGATLGWYRTAYPRSSVAMTRTGRETLIKEALNYFDSQGHDFSQYDNNGDGLIDYFCVFWTGPDNGWSNFWWGYYTTWSSSFILDGKQFSGCAYSWQWEKRGSGLFTPVVVMHETGHSLGLPDLYDYDGTIGPAGGVGGLDMMDNNWGDHNGFSKMLLDWLTPQVVGLGSRTVVLRPTATYPDAVIFWPNYSLASPFREFFMIQNRIRTSNDYTYPADGFLIWHIDATLNGSGIFTYDNSDSAHKLVRLMEADGLEEIEKNRLANAGDFYIQGKTFNKNTTPNSNAYDGSLTNAYLDTITSAGVDMSCNISFGGKTLQIAVNNTSLGTTSPVPGIYTYSTGSDVEVRVFPAQYCVLTGWSGDAIGKEHTVIINLDRDKSVTANFKLVSPPSNLTAVRQTNRSVTQTEYIVDLSWDENPANAGLNIVIYCVYQKVGESWVKLAELPINARTYRHRMAPKDEQVYGVTLVNEGGVESAKTTVVK